MTKAMSGAVVDALAGVSLFSGCSRRELEKIARLGTELKVADGAALTVEGRLGREFILVMAGEASCSIDGVEIARFGPGDSFGELSLLDGGPRTATVVADGEATILVLDQREFGELLDASPSIARKLLVELAARQRSVTPDPMQH
jgi:CRP/FNR family cyclic AMP-dependent transcriptional regulator